MIDNPQMRLRPEDLVEIAEALTTARLDTRVMEVAGHRVYLRLKPLLRNAPQDTPRELQVVDIISLRSEGISGIFGRIAPVRAPNIG